MRPSSQNGSASVERVFGSEETALEYRAAKMKGAISNTQLLLLVTNSNGVPPKSFRHKSKKSSEVLLNLPHIKQLSPSLGFGIARALSMNVRDKTNKKEQSSDNNNNSAG